VTSPPLDEATIHALEAQLREHEAKLEDVRRKLMPRASGPAQIQLEMAKLGDLRAAEKLLEQTRELARKLPAQVALGRASISEARASFYEQEAEKLRPKLERLRTEEAKLKLLSMKPRARLNRPVSNVKGLRIASTSFATRQSVSVRTKKAITRSTSKPWPRSLNEGDKMSDKTEYLDRILKAAGLDHHPALKDHPEVEQRIRELGAIFDSAEKAEAALHPLRSRMSTAEKVQFINKHGYERFIGLPH
jgi:hypothetical protein